MRVKIFKQFENNSEFFADDFFVSFNPSFFWGVEPNKITISLF
jgi:hypothetical protein